MVLNSNNHGLLIVKFGGSSLADGIGISRSANLIAKEYKKGTKIVVIVSAMGKATDNLISTAKSACEDRIQSKHLDDIMAMGERTSARIFAAALRSRGLKVHLFDPSEKEWPIITDNKFTNAKPILPLCKKIIKSNLGALLEEGIIPVVPGFIGKTENGEITTMGRGGSDITALLIADCLKADQVIFVTDVDGIMTADPKIIKNPKKLEHVDIEVLVGLADTGAKFIHKKALKYKNARIDIKVIKNTVDDLRAGGTIIAGGLPSNMVIEVYPKSIMAVTITGKDISKSPEIIRSFLEIVEREEELLGMSMNHNSTILYLPLTSKAGRLLEELHSIVVSQKDVIAMAVKRNLALLKIKGVGLEETPGVISKISETLRRQGINIYGVFTITSSVSVFVDAKDKNKAAELVKESLDAESRII
ncbi:TPA: aspartate kinase [Candidatus Bathyarchaeota archaeon]|nr:aspartate kinase [Candidatus Bathyarchaeota archaeon]